MGAVIGDMLFLGLGIVIGPVPLIAVILLLSGKRGQSKGVAYMAGWVLGLTLLVVAVVLLVRGYDYSRHTMPSLLVSWGTLLGGVALLVVAYVTWKRRPPPDVTPPMPGWLQSIERATPLMSLGTGFFFGLFSVKNLIFTVAAAVTIGKAQLDAVQSLIAILLFILFATSGIATPVYVSFAKREVAQATFDRWIIWLRTNNTLIICLLCLLLGVRLIGDGLGELL